MTGWQTKKLGDVCDFEGGSQPPKSQFIYKEKSGYVRFLQIRDFRSDKNITYIQESKKNRLCKEDDILIGRYGASVGKILTSKAGAYNVALMKTIPNLDLLDRCWFYYYLISDEFQRPLLNIAARSAQDGFSKDDISNFPVAVPPRHEQQRIVGILDEAFEGIAIAKANAEKNLQNTRSLFESHLKSVFTQRGKEWKEKTLEEVATTFGRGKSKHRPRNAPHLYGGKYPFVQTGDIRNADHTITEYSQTYSEVGLAQSKLWPKGTICITIAANIAETAILGFDACFPDSVIGVVANPKEADVGFIEYLLQSFKARIQTMGKGSAQANINMGTFENERFPFPCVSEQKQIAERLDGLRDETLRLESIYQQKLDALEALKKSLLHQAFNGELGVKAAA
jgi:type I restriction enzyme, S subunit